MTKHLIEMAQSEPINRAGITDFFARCSCGWSTFPSPARWRAEAECAEHEAWAALIGRTLALEGYAQWTARGAHGQHDYGRAVIMLDGCLWGFDSAGDGVGRRTSVADPKDVPYDVQLRIPSQPIVTVHELVRPWCEILYLVDERTGLVVLEIGDDRPPTGDGCFAFKVNLSGYEASWLSEAVA